MAVGIAVGQANAILDALCRSVAYSDPAGFFLQLHTGDPGAAGTSNQMGDTTRQSVTFSAAASGAITNSAAVEWTNLQPTGASETVSHWSAWSASTAGTFLFSDDLASSRVVADNDNFTIAIGDLDINIAVIAA
jgi:hypothetical protein